MIEALIDPDTGDVIVVKPLGSVWGRCEVNAVVKLDDPELEKELAGKQHIVHPYAANEALVLNLSGGVAVGGLIRGKIFKLIA